jgi:hypothetical protein
MKTTMSTLLARRLTPAAHRLDPTSLIHSFYCFKTTDTEKITIRGGGTTSEAQP